MQIIADSYSHVGLLESVLVCRNTCGERDILERSPTIAPVEIVRLTIVSDKKVQLSITIKIRPDRSQSLAVFRIVDYRFFRHIGECPVSIVVIETVGRAL